MKPTKRGICIDNELANFVYELHRLAKISENKVYLRMLQIAKEDLAPFEGRGLVAVLVSPWETIRNLPALRRQMEKRSYGGKLRAVVGIRLTGADYVALRSFMQKHKTTISGGLREIVQRILTTEAA